MKALRQERLQAAIELLAFKLERELVKGHSGLLNAEEINDVLMVAGAGVVTPESAGKREIEVIE